MRNFLKLYTLLSSANIWETLLMNFLLCDLMTALQDFKILAEFSMVFIFEKSLIYALPKFNWNLMSVGCYLYFSIGNLTWNVFSGKFFNVSN